MGFCQKHVCIVFGIMSCLLVHTYILSWYGFLQCIREFLCYIFYSSWISTACSNWLPTIFFKWPLVLPWFLDCRIFWDRGFLHGSLWITKTNMLIVRDWHDGVELQTLDQWDQSSFSIVVHIQIGVFYSPLHRFTSTNKRIVRVWHGGEELWIF